MGIEDLAEDGISLEVRDGVKVMWQDLQTDPSVHLAFRVGQADEELAARGYTHLAEHLLLHRFVDASFAVNGQTGFTVTGIYSTARAPRLIEFANTALSVLDQISNGSIEDEMILHEAKVLGAEAASRTRGPIEEACADLYGASAFGLLAWDELGLADLDIERFREWVRLRFTRDSLVVTFTCEPPPGLDLTPILSGATYPPPTAAPSAAQPPGYRERPMPLGLVAPVTRSMGFPGAIGIAHRAVFDVLRTQLGSSYAPGLTYEPVSATEALVLGVIDSDPDSRSTVASRVIEILDRLIDPGPGPAQLHRMVNSYRENAPLAAFRTARLHSQATSLLLGGPTFSSRHIEEIVSSATSSDVSRCIAELRRSMVLSVPTGSQIDRTRLEALPAVRPARKLNGHLVTYRGDAPRGGVRVPELTLSKDGVTLVSRDDTTTTIETSEAAALIRWHDGGHAIVGRSGAAIRLYPHRWYDADRAVSHFAGLAEPHQVKTMGLRLGPPDSHSFPRSASARALRNGLIVLSTLPVALVAVAVAFFFPLALPLLFLVVVPFQKMGRKAQRPILRHTYDVASWHPSDPARQPDITATQAHLWGGMTLGWLARNRLLRGWIEEALAGELADYRRGSIEETELYMAAEGVLASDMCWPDVADFLTYLHSPFSPRRSRPTPFERIQQRLTEDVSSVYDLDVDPALRDRFNHEMNTSVRRFRLVRPVVGTRLTRLVNSARNKAPDPA